MTDPVSLEQNVNTNSRPSDLRITDIRTLSLKGLPMSCIILRIDTNQGISGYGEIRDGASKSYALLLKSRLVGENPCNIDKIFRKIKQFGFHARQGGGVCAVEMALFDLAGKAYGVPAYQLAGGKFRDKILCYADTPSEKDPTAMAAQLKRRMAQGFQFLKMDVGIDLVADIPGAINAPPGMIATRDIMHPFTGIQLTTKGIDALVELRRHDPRSGRLRTAAGIGSLRASQSRIVHPAGARTRSVHAGVVRGHDPLAVRRSIPAPLAVRDDARSAPARTFTSRKASAIWLKSAPSPSSTPTS